MKPDEADLEIAVTLCSSLYTVCSVLTYLMQKHETMHVELKWAEEHINYALEYLEQWKHDCSARL